MKFIFWPDESDDGAMLGGKARALSALLTSGLEIPPWFVILPQAFEASLAGSELESLRSGGNAQEFDAILSRLMPGREMIAELDRALVRLCPDRDVVAVRSSAQEEDGSEVSFAGQLESFLAVRAEDVAGKIVEVWRSAFAPRVRAYREQHNRGLKFSAPAVLVQRMVRADVSGVAFGADPVTGQRNHVVISAVPGLGQELVGGETDADTWHVDASDNVILRQTASKRSVLRLKPDGIRREALLADESMQPSLRDDELRAVAAMVRRTGEFFGRPQDIEWAIESGRLFLLQSRAITSPTGVSREDDQLAIWDNSNIIESYCGVTTLLTFSFARRAYEGVYRQFCCILAVPKKRIAAHDQTFRHMLGLMRGRIYYNLLNWYRVLALLPGFTINRRFMEQMMGVKEEMPAEIIAGLSRAGFGARLKDGIDLAFSVMALAVNHLRLPQKIRCFRARLDAALQPTATSIETMTSGELSSCFLGLERSLLRRWDAPLLNDFFTMIFYGLLRDLTAKWAGDSAGLLQNDLLCGGGGMISAEPARRIEALAQMACVDRKFVKLLCEAPSSAIVPVIENVPGFRKAFDDYLATFGDRCFEELKLESPTLNDDPLPLFRAVGQLASARLRCSGSPAAAIPEDPRACAEKRMSIALKRRPVRRMIFHWILRHARSGVRERENLRFERTRLFGVVRRIFGAMGHRLHSQGHLAQARDVFYLEIDELLGFVSGAATTTRLMELVKVRKAEFAAYRDAVPLPDRFTTRGIPSQCLPAVELTPSAGITSGDERRGIGCCPGVVRGRICKVMNPGQSVVRSGEILVAERTDPGWIMLFPGAVGLLVERGSLLSHSAIVARELRLPAIVSISGLTAWLNDGDHVEFDGSTGVVRKLAPDSGKDPSPSLIQSMQSQKNHIGAETSSTITILT